MDFIRRPKSKILKIKNHNISEAGSASETLWILVFNILIFYSSDDG
jgi:hypothetical protein